MEDPSQYPTIGEHFGTYDNLLKFFASATLLALSIMAVQAWAFLVAERAI